MTRIEREASFQNNSIIVLSGAPPDETGVARRLVDDLHQLRIDWPELQIEYVALSGRQHLGHTMHQIASRAEQGLRPILHLDMHGDPQRGLKIASSGEFAPWVEVTAWLRAINTRTHNNLGVVGAACFSMHLIKPISIFQPAPFFFLVAPRSQVLIPVIDGGMPSFYRSLLGNEGLTKATTALGPDFSAFHCERILTIAFARYLTQQTKGRALTERREHLLTDALQSCLPRSRANLSLLRRRIKQQLRPTDELIQRYASTFLHGREYNISLQALLDLIK